MAKTHVICDGINQARMLMMHLYGEVNVFSVKSVMDKDVTEGTKTLSASELQVKTLADKSKQLNQQAKRMKARQGLQKAQEKLQIANKLSSES